MTSVFESFRHEAWPFRYEGTLLVGTIAGGTPTDPKVAEGWLKTKLAPKDDLIRDMVAEVMVERGVTAEEAVEAVDIAKHLNGFKRDENGLYIEGRQLKAAIKEAACICLATEMLPVKWGKTNKGIKAFFAEHVCVEEDRLYLGVSVPSGINQRFVHTWRGDGIQYEEYVEDAKIDFTVSTDYEFKDREWAMLWLKGQEQGIGAARSQGFGRYSVIRWDRVA